MDWSKYKADFVRTKEIDGQRLVLEFEKDFKNKFNRTLCITCVRQFNADFQKYIESMSENKVNYKLKAKYNNISLGFGKRGRLSNENMNDKDAAFLMKQHPKGKDLFDIYPKEEEVYIKPKTKKIKSSD